jgi:hypothetical protein
MGLYHQAKRWKGPTQSRPRNNQSTRGSSQRRTRKYFEWYNATKRGIKYYNRFKQPYFVKRYRQTWSQKYGQQTIQRPAWRPPAAYNYNFPRGTWGQGPPQSPSAGPLWPKPQLSYEQQNKVWQQYTPFTVRNYNPFQTNKPPAQNLDEATNRRNKVYSDNMLAVGSYMRFPPEIGDLGFVYNQTPRDVAKRPKPWVAWAKRFLPFPEPPPPDPPEFGDIPPRQYRFKPRRGCMHWDETLQKEVPCAQKFSRSRFKSRSTYTPRQHYGPGRFRRNYRFKNNTSYTRYPGRRSRSYPGFKRVYYR